MTNVVVYNNIFMMEEKYTNGGEYDLAYEKLFMPHFYSDDTNYTLDKAFAISNEALGNFFDGINLKGKKVLTVGSSGDQAINAILCGSKDVTIIDGNVFARPFIEYKLAMIKVFDFETFDSLFIKQDAFEWQVYAKISHLLSPEVQQFWDTLMLDQNFEPAWGDFGAKTIKDNMLIVDHRDRHSAFYKDKKTYNKLQRLLNSQDVRIDFINAEFCDFPKVVCGKYDFIYLSNIYDYFDGTVKSELFSKTVEKLYDANLKNGGNLVVNYEFNEKATGCPKKFGKHKVFHKQLQRYSDGEYTTDTAWTIKKDGKPEKSNFDDDMVR